MTAHDLPSAALADRGATTVYALARIDGRAVAVESRHVARVARMPAEPIGLPRSHGVAADVIVSDGRVLPVMRLSRWLGAADGTADARTDLVLILEDGGRGVGVAVSEVLGTRSLRHEALERLYHDDRPDELFQSAALFDGDETATVVLDPLRLMALAQVHLANAGDDADARAVTSSATPVGTTPRASIHAVFRIADIDLALPAGQVGELLRRGSIRTELPLRDGVLGLCEWRDRLVPVVDLSDALEALPSDEPAELICIVVDGDAAIGLVVHETREIARLADAAGTPIPLEAGTRPIVRRDVVFRGRTLQVLDVPALFERWPVSAIGAPRLVAESAASARRDPDAPAYMVFDAGGRFAAPVAGVREVVELPEALRPRLEAGVETVLSWRRRAVPVRPIADRLVNLAIQDARQLVVVQQGDQLVALPIAGVDALVPRGIARAGRMPLWGRPVPVVSIDTPDRRATYPVVELDATPRPGR